MMRLAEMFTRKRTGWKERHSQLARLIATQTELRKQSPSPPTSASTTMIKTTNTTQPLGHIPVAAVGRIIQRLSTGLRKSARSFSVLFRRAWRQVSRDKALNIARFMSSFFSALLFGAIYYQLGDSAATVPDRLGLLQVAAVNTAMTALIKATTSFVTEKIIVQRERRTGAYSVAPYFISKLAAEAPISAFFPCMAGFIMYKLCGLNDAPGRLARFPNNPPPSHTHSPMTSSLLLHPIPCSCDYLFTCRRILSNQTHSKQSYDMTIRTMESCSNTL